MTDSAVDWKASQQPEKSEEHQENHAAAAQALNAIGIPKDFTDQINWFEAKHSKAYKGVCTYGINYDDIPPLENGDAKLLEQQIRAHEMAHLYWGWLISPKLNVVIPPEIDFGHVASEHQGQLEFWTIMQTLPKQLLALSDFSFHHQMPGSTERAVMAINQRPDEFLAVLQKSCLQNRVSIDYGLASVLEYLEGITTNDFYAKTGLGRSLEEGLVTYLSSAAIYGDDISKWQVQEDKRAVYYRNKFHEIFGGPDKLIAFIQKCGMDNFIEKVKTEIQSESMAQIAILNRTGLPSGNEPEKSAEIKSLETIPKTFTEQLLYSVYVLMVENKELSVATKFVRNEYKDNCRLAASYLQARSNEANYATSILPDLCQIVEKIATHDGDVCVCTDTHRLDLDYTSSYSDHEMRMRPYFQELLKAFGVESLDDILKKDSSLLRDPSSNQGQEINSEIVSISNVPSPFEIVSVLSEIDGDSDLARQLQLVNARLVLIVNPQYNEIHYQLVCQPDSQYTQESVWPEGEIEIPAKKPGNGDNYKFSSVEKLSALVHTLKGGNGELIQILGPDDVPPVFKPYWDQSPIDPDAGRIRTQLDDDDGGEQSLFDRAQGLNKTDAALVLFTYALKKQKLTEYDWALLKARLPFSTVDLLAELISQREDLKAKQMGEHEDPVPIAPLGERLRVRES